MVLHDGLYKILSSFTYGPGSPWHFLILGLTTIGADLTVGKSCFIKPTEKFQHVFKVLCYKRLQRTWL